MEKEFVSYKLAVKLKELGFDEPCCGYYDHSIKELDTISSDVCERLCKHDTHIKAPLKQQAFRWFREKYDLYSWIQLHNGYINDSFYPELPITFSIMDRKTGNESYERDIPHNYLYKTNEEAELACLTKLIEIVENK